MSQIQFNSNWNSQFKFPIQIQFPIQSVIGKVRPSKATIIRSLQYRLCKFNCKCWAALSAARWGVGGETVLPELSLTGESRRSMISQHAYLDEPVQLFLQLQLGWERDVLGIWAPGQHLPRSSANRGHRHLRALLLCRCNGESHDNFGGDQVQGHANHHQLVPVQHGLFGFTHFSLHASGLVQNLEVPTLEFWQRTL